MLVNRRFSMLGMFTLVVVMTLSGCASRGFVRRNVSALEPRIEENANAARENAERIDAVDGRAQEGIAGSQQAANRAQQTADTANQAANQAQQTAQNANQGVQQASNRISTIETRLTTLDQYTAGQPQAITFATNSSDLSAEAQGTLDTIARGLAGQRGGYLVEIQGFTDATGSDNYNLGLSQRRAESVQRYLVSQGVQLSRISIVGLGEGNPVAPNNTAQGRQQNRRVEVRVLRLAQGGSTSD